MTEYLLNDGRKLEIKDCEWSFNPREGYESKICIRPHRRYEFVNELNFDFAEDHRVDWTDLYYIFPMDCYEHSGISFSLSGAGMQCQFDTSKDCGFIAIQKKIKLTDDSIRITRTEEEAKNMAIEEIKEYNQYVNGECYEWFTYLPEVWTNSTGETKIEWTTEDGCVGYLNEDDILSEFEKYEPKEIFNS